MAIKGWRIKSLGSVLDRVADQINPIPDVLYREIGIRSHGKGIFHKVPVLGISLGDKRVFKVYPDCFVVNIVFAWEQAVARTTIDEDGMIASHRFPMYKPKNDLCDVDFLAYYFKTKKGKYLLELASPGGAGRNKTLGQKEFLRMKFPMPSGAEQARIAQALSTWDKAIKTTVELIANSKAQKKALMQQLLTGKTRFTEFTEKWRSVKLSGQCDVRRGASPRPINDDKWFSSHGRGWIRIADVTTSKFQVLMRTTQYLGDQGVKNSVAVDPGDLIMSICGTIGVPKFVGIPACIHDGFVVFRNVKSSLSLNFLYHYLNFICDKLAAGGQPGTQKNLNTSIVGNTLIPFVSLAEQERIASVLSKAESEELNLNEQLLRLKKEKTALMRQLLTGKRRVKLHSAA